MNDKITNYVFVRNIIIWIPQEPYGYATKKISNNTHAIHSIPATKEHLEDWLDRTCEFVDK
jgi:hypothetical protein